MLTNPTLDHMYTLGLSGMAAAWRELAEQPEARAMEKEEWLGLMLDREIAVRADKRLTARLVAAKLRFPEACVEDIDFHAARNLDRRSTMALAQGQWLKNHENLIVTGKTGTGKSWLACAMGRQAARHDHTVLYVRTPRLFEDLAMAKLDGRYPRLMNRLMKVQLLILDDFATHTLNDQQRFHLFEIIEERYQRRSTLITAQVPVNTWHDLIGDATVADAILDRVVHNAHRINLEGDSMRKAKSRIDATLNVNDERTEG
ncbi:AAA family ATPase [Brucella tritici]|uniref:IS21-like element helper ATPase IstB n=1 Tax=Brucella tritici TaxID=94626 RepID=UPI00124E6F45|nr:IS21-like element helper ATPase IstB [Brucella tritici]KAB2667650.1 AAA family ATPase [Brucella tritici]